MFEAGQKRLGSGDSVCLSRYIANRGRERARLRFPGTDRNTEKLPIVHYRAITIGFASHALSGRRSRVIQFSLRLSF